MEAQMDLGFDVPKQVTVGGLEALCSEIASLREKASQLSTEKKQVEDSLALKEGLLVEMLNASGISSYHSRVGTATITHRTSVRVPATLEEKEAFFNYLRSKGLFDAMVTVNSRTLASFYKQELEAAKATEDGVEFRIPGINHVTVEEQLSFRRK